MMKRDPAVQVWIRVLLGRKLDVAPDRDAAGLARAAIRRFHDARAATGHDRESRLRQPPTEVASQSVVGMILGEAWGAEQGTAGAREVKAPKAAHDLGEDPDRTNELEASGLGTAEEAPHLRRPGRLPWRHRGPAGAIVTGGVRAHQRNVSGSTPR